MLRSFVFYSCEDLKKFDNLRTKPQGYKINSCSAELSMKFILLINVLKMKKKKFLWYFYIIIRINSPHKFISRINSPSEFIKQGI